MDPGCTPGNFRPKQGLKGEMKADELLAAVVFKFSNEQISRIADCDQRQCVKAVCRVADYIAKQEKRRSGEHDCRGPWVAPGFVRPRQHRLPLSQQEQGQEARTVNGGKEERGDGDQPCEGPGDYQ